MVILVGTTPRHFYIHGEEQGEGGTLMSPIASAMGPVTCAA